MVTATYRLVEVVLFEVERVLVPLVPVELLERLELPELVLLERVLVLLLRVL